jgi:hypothetical protein
MIFFQILFHMLLKSQICTLRREQKVSTGLETAWPKALSKPPIDYDGPTGYYEWIPAFSPAGRRFEPTAERALEPVIKTLASRLPGSASGVLAASQFAGPSGIADLVAVTKAQLLLAARIRTGTPPLRSLSDASVVATVAIRRTTTASHVARVLGISEVQTTRRLRQLSESGFLFQDGSGYRRCPEFVPIGRMYALEAKVSDWRGAIAQALRYVRWADAAAVVLLKGPRDLRNLKDYAKTLRIGVAIGNQWIVKPVLQPVAPGLRLLASEMFVAAIMK